MHTIRSQAHAAGDRYKRKVKPLSVRKIVSRKPLSVRSLKFEATVHISARWKPHILILRLKSRPIRILWLKSRPIPILNLVSLCVSLHQSLQSDSRARP